MNIEAIGFDLDNTLLVPDRDRKAILQDATERVNAPSIDREEYLAIHKQCLTKETREPIFTELLQSKDTTVSAHALTEAYRSLVNEAVQLVPGSCELLNTIGEDYMLGLLTNGPSRAQRDKITQYNIDEYLDTIVISGEIQAGKPDPLAFKTLSQRLGASPGTSVFVGDNLATDIDGGIRAGFTVIQV